MGRLGLDRQLCSLEIRPLSSATTSLSAFQYLSNGLRHSLTGEAYIRGLLYRKYPVGRSKKIDEPSSGIKWCNWHDVFTLTRPIGRKPRPEESRSFMMVFSFILH
jgi:hypothetical protein